MCEMSKPCAVFEEDEINSAFYVGQSKIIGDTITDMVAVAADNIQAELWVGAQDYLPRLIRVAYPRKPAHALYQTKHSDWHLLDAVDPATFTSAKPVQGKPINFAPPGIRQTATGALPPLPQQQQQQQQQQ